MTTKEIVLSLTELSTRAEAITAILVLMGLLVGYMRWVRPRVKRAVRTTNAIVDTLVGREAIVDHATGRVLSAEQPGIGVRMAKLEDVVTTMAQQDKRLTDLEVTSVDHEKRLAAQEQAAVERAVTRAESLTHLAMLAKAQGMDPSEILPDFEAGPDAGDESD